MKDRSIRTTCKLRTQAPSLLDPTKTITGTGRVRAVTIALTVVGIL